MSRRLSIGVVHHNLMRHRGGGDFVCAWALEALHKKYDVTLITWGPALDWTLFNPYYGTSIAPGSVRIMNVPTLQGLRLDRRPFRLILALLERYVKSVSSQFDLMLSTYSELDFGRPGLQYVHSPSRNAAAAKLYLVDYSEGPCRRLYHRVFDWFSDFNPSHLRTNETLVNSEWSRVLFDQTYPGSSVRVLYPPVLLTPGIPMPWAQRPAYDFLCVGDLVAEKKVLEAIGVIEALNRRGWICRLHIIGDGQSAYATRVKQSARRSGAVVCHGRLDRAEMSALLRTHRYGLHMRDIESFGIALAEMATAGMLVFAHEGGAQAEVLDHRPELLFKDMADAVTKIETVLKTPELQDMLGRRLEAHARSFSAERFSKGLNDAVERFLNTPYVQT